MFGNTAFDKEMLLFLQYKNDADDTVVKALKHNEVLSFYIQYFDFRDEAHFHHCLYGPSPAYRDRFGTAAAPTEESTNKLFSFASWVDDFSSPDIVAMTPGQALKA
ncbi:hypothetical protein QBC32DRAFT_317332 [Pseudoneurospora amorphoporcata]|uniref:Uncharacterized protein n=1 Tax=Pseudoneurospora amorphoporcata TaxID=241081 RepID=A0AAN6SCV0_9PEZI|nr:hypothetical protein QBC32DRAFT_317332 [Pseudoneurospora amorphoporcata]